MNLVIVESPAKAKTIEGFLGKDFVVKSSYGHVRDLPSKGLSIDIDNDFKPSYEVMPDKKKVIAELKKMTKKADIIWLATDEDREGEAISWHLADELKLDGKKTKRIVFHEITKSAITNAIENPRQIDKNLVDAQQARRVLDRIVGFELSPVLWKKVKPSLSAGRVQSVTVRLIVEREREIEAFDSQSYYRVKGIFNHNGKTFESELSKRLNTKQEVEAFLEGLKSASFSVENVETKPAKRSPAAPFTTSTLQQEASRKLGYSVNQTMRVAQTLYEQGLITYMRTDSVNLSMTAIEGAKAAIQKDFGEEYVNPRKYSTKSSSAQEAHEAIRPTDFGRQQISGSSQEQRLYELIWKRGIASQMSDAKLQRTTISIDISSEPSLRFVSKGEVVLFDGFLKVYIESSDDDGAKEEAQGFLPQVEKGMSLDSETIQATQRFTQHPPRYTEASLVKKLEELGIGRPSTYAPTISTIQNRGYVVKEDREGHPRKYDYYELKNGELKVLEKTENTGAEKNKMFPTDIGVVVTDFLMKNFETIMDFHFTADVEQKFDTIAQGGQEWTSMIKDFYKPFHHNVEDTLENSDRASGERLLGEDPKSGRPVFARIGRYGPMVQIGSVEDDEKPQFAKLQPDQSITSITFEEALELFKLPRTVGEYEDKTVVAAVGRFGPYIRFDGKFVNLGELDPLKVTLDEAVKLIEEKREADRNRIIHDFENEPPLQVLRGRYGPYISLGKENYKIPKGTDAETLTKEQCLEIIENNPPTKKKRRASRK